MNRQILIWTLIQKIKIKIRSGFTNLINEQFIANVMQTLQSIMFAYFTLVNSMYELTNV